MKLILVLLAAFCLGGCFGPQKRGVDVSYHELLAASKSPAEVSASPLAGVRKVEVRSISWLATADMQYRFAYSDPTRRRNYADSRWVAMPSEMIELAMSRALIGSAASSLSGCRLRVDLDEFIQEFDGPQTSSALIAARFSLLGPRGESALAHHRVHLTRPTPTGDAAGGVLALSALAGEMVTESAAWLGRLKRDTPVTVAPCAQ